MRYFGVPSQFISGVFLDLKAYTWCCFFRNHECFCCATATVARCCQIPAVLSPDSRSSCVHTSGCSGNHLSTYVQESVERRCIRDFLEAVPSEEPELAALASAVVSSAGSVDTPPNPPETSASAGSALSSNISEPGLPFPSHLQPAIPCSIAEESIRISGPEADEQELGQMMEASQPDDIWAPFWVARKALAKCCHCIDIVTADIRETNCFTKAYARYVKGTGSVLATQNLQVLDTFADWGHREEVCHWPFSQF